MITMATDVGKPATSYAGAPLRHHSSVCYAGSKHSAVEQSVSRNTAQNRRFSQLRPVVVAQPRYCRGMLPPLDLLGPMDFSNYVQRQYPHLQVSNEITVLLKEINARCLSHLATARWHIQLEKMKFADKIIDARNRVCTCCAACGFADCPPRDDDVTTLVRTAIAGRRFHLSPCEGNTSSSKRSRTLHTPQQTNVPQLDSALHHILQAVTLFAKENMQAISGLYIDLPSDGSTTVFGERRPDLPGRKYVSWSGFQTDPWVRGAVPYPPQAGVAELLEQYFISAPDSDLAG